MPIYEYRCASCGERFERLVSREQREEGRCPHCRGNRVERLLSTFAVGRPAATGSSPGPCGSSPCACRASDA